ncbi:MAG: ABC transporter substrate-binding protein [Synechococcus sp. TMED90]|nr:MAG: ABC transporter substrate-binding protein [Synechococcus sp. TMED90]
MKAATSSLPPLRRRTLLQIGALGVAAGLAGCAQGVIRPTLRAPADILPSLWRRQLPAPWRFEPLSGSTPFQSPWPKPTDLMALADGWLSSLTPDQLQSVAAPALAAELGPLGQRFLTQAPSAWSSKLLPVGFSPYVLLFRREGRARPAADDGWMTLLDPALKGKVLLPASPRLLMSLADRMDGPDVLSRLRQVAISFDDRYGLNWLLQGDARVAVLPLQRCMQALKRDPRLTAVLPESGAPLHWTLLARPAGTAEPLPQAWVSEAWKPPLLARLLAQGWIPPLSREELLEAGGRVPTDLRALVLPSQEVWMRSWTLYPAADDEVFRLQQRWRSSAP